MRIAVARTALAAAGLAVLGMVGGASAATVGPASLVLTDPAGDKAVPVGSGDIVKLTYTTQGKTTKVGKKTTYTPKSLVITMELADAVNTTGDVEYEVDADLAGCGSFSVYTTPGADADGGSAGCGGTGSIDPVGLIPDTSTSLTPTITIAGKTITFLVEFAQYPDALKAGAVLSATHAFTAEVDPATGFVGPYLLDSTFDTDELTSDATYKIG